MLAWDKMLVLGMLSLGLAVPGDAQGIDELDLPFGLPGAKADSVARFSARAIVSHDLVAPGESFHVAVAMTVAPDMWLYGPAPGGQVVKPVALEVELGGSKLKAAQVLFGPTQPHRTEYPDGKVDVHYVYEGHGYLFVPVTAPPGTPPGALELPIEISGQVCELSGACVLVGQQVTAKVEVGAAGVASPQWTEQLAAFLARATPTGQPATATTGPAQATVLARRPGVELTVAAGLGLALLAGLILNIMPCVLPVIPLRLLALLEQAKHARSRFFTLGMAFAAGVLLFFVALAAANVALKLALQYTLKWAEPYRHPEFVIPMVLFLVALAANMFGAFTITVPGRIAAAEAGQGHLGAVGMGFLMAVLSTPCSFAILAAAFGWAQAQPLWLGTVGILTIGVGMAAPHAALAGFPAVVRRIPRAGRWTELFKQFAGFVLLLIAVWLLRTQMSESYPAWVMAYAVVLAMCLWVWGSWVRYDAPAVRKWLLRGVAAAIAAAAGIWMLTPSRPLAVAMQPFDASAISRARAEGKTVLVKFTATWCTECIFLDKLIYDSAEVAEALRVRKVVAFKGDLTKRGTPAEEMLEKQLRQPGPPVTAIFPSGTGPPVLLVGPFSKADLISALDAAAGAS